MAHRRGGFRSRGISQSQRRKKTWFQAKIANEDAAVAGRSRFATSFNLETLAPGAGVGISEKVAFASIADPDVGEGGEVSSLPEESTILRARGSLVFPKTDITAGLQQGWVSQQFAYGFGVMDVRSLVEGSFPGPIIDADWDGWMFLRQSGVAPVDSIGTVMDVKAMRKIQSGDAFFMAAETVNGEGATPGVVGSWNVDLRVLLFLP